LRGKYASFDSQDTKGYSPENPGKAAGFQGKNERGVLPLLEKPAVRRLFHRSRNKAPH